jgi:hypothetical protein
MPDHEPPAVMTDMQLKTAIEEATQRRDALIREAFGRPSFPRTWLPRGVVWTEYTDHSHDGNQSA